MNTFRTHCLRPIALSVLLACLPTAHAADEAQLDPITVRAQNDGYAPGPASNNAGVLTSIEETPFTVNTVERAFIEDRGVKDMGDLAEYVPGVTVRATFNGGYQRINVRGFQLDELGGFTRNGVKIYRRGDLATANVERVEFLKGPAAVNASSIAPGGLVNIVTKTPLSTDLRRVEAEIDQHGGWEVRADYNAPQVLGSDHARMRVNLAFQDDSRIFTDRVKNDDVFIAPVFDFRLSDDTLLRLDTEFRRFTRVAQPGLLAIFPNEAAELGTTPEAFLDRQRRANFLGENNALYHWNNQTYNLELFHTYSPKITLHALVSYAYSERDLFALGLGTFGDGALVDGVSLADTTLAVRGAGLFDDDSAVFDSYQHTLVYEFDLRGETTLGGLTHTWMVGADSERRRDRYTRYLAGGSASPIDVFDPVQTNDFTGLVGAVPSGFERENNDDQFAVFAQAHTRFGTSGWSALYGVRHVDYDNVTTGDSTRDTLFRFGVAYIPPALPDTTFFVGYSESFEPTGVTTRLPNPEPISGRQIEAGVKQFFAGRALFAQASLFRIEQQNIIVNTAPAPLDSQDAEAESQGVELEIVGRLTPRLSVSANYSYINLRKSSGSISGQDLGEDTPENKAALWLNYDAGQIVPGLRLGGGVRYVDERTILPALTSPLTATLCSTSSPPTNSPARPESA